MRNMQSTLKSSFIEKLEDRQLLSSCAITGLSKNPPENPSAATGVHASPLAKVIKKTVKKAATKRKGN